MNGRNVLSPPEADRALAVLKTRFGVRDEQSNSTVSRAFPEGRSAAKASPGQGFDQRFVQSARAAAFGFLFLAAADVGPRGLGFCRRQALLARAATGSRERHSARQARQEGVCHRGAFRGAHRRKKSVWGPLNGHWVAHDTRDTVVDFLRSLSERTEPSLRRLVGWLCISRAELALAAQVRQGTERSLDDICPRPSRLGELLRSILCLGAESVVETRQRVSDSMDAAKVQAPAPPQVTGRAAAFQTRSLQSKGVCALGAGDFPRWLGDGSRMSREVHVRFCEGLGLKCPGLLTRI